MIEWLTEPVWLGNFIVARWAGLLAITVALVGASGLIVILAGVGASFVRWLWHAAFGGG